MKIKNFNSGWGQMVVTHARGRQLIRLGVTDVKTKVADHNETQHQIMNVYMSRGYRVWAA